MACLFLDGVSLRMRRASGRQRVHIWWPTECVKTAPRQLPSFMRSQGVSQTAWEGLLEDPYRPGLEGNNLLLIVTDGWCPGLAAAIETLYPRALHQRCWVRTRWEILEKVPRRDYDAVKAEAQAIYRADTAGRGSSAAGKA